MSFTINAIIDRLQTAFPACFNRAEPKPLKMGLGAELLARAGLHPTLADLSRTQLRRALRVYTTAPAYQKALARGGPRYDLAGQPVGEVTPEQQAQARNGPQTPLPGPEPSPAPGFLKMSLKRRVRPDVGG